MLASYQAPPPDGIGELLEAGTFAGGAGDGVIGEAVGDGPVLAVGAGLADAELVLDGGVALLIGGVPGVEGGAHGAGLSGLQGKPGCVGFVCARLGTGGMTERRDGLAVAVAGVDATSEIVVAFGHRQCRMAKDGTNHGHAFGHGGGDRPAANSAPPPCAPGKGEAAPARRSPKSRRAARFCAER